MNEQLLRELGDRFDRADRVLFLVGGSVRDKVLGRQPKDWDFATDALPAEIKGILGHGDWADAIWDVGERFGTIAARKDDVDIEITTFRADGPGRKPEVTFTDSLEEDLIRRDFTFNAMAIRVDAQGLDGQIIDPFGGARAIEERRIDTPRAAEESFSDDPLRMLRAARFAAQLGFQPVRRVRVAMHGLRERLLEISAERIQVELDKILVSDNPEAGLDSLWRERLLEVALPGVQWSPSWDLLTGDDVDTRWASLLQNLEPHEANIKLQGLKFSNDRRQRIVNLVAWLRKWHHVDWLQADASLIRTVIAQTGPEFVRLAKLLRASDSLLPRANALLQREGAPVPPLSGKEVMLAAGLKPGPKVGAAMQHLWELTLQRGPMAKDEAVKELIAWA